MTATEKPDPAVAAAAADIDLLVTPSDLLALGVETPRKYVKQRQGPGNKMLDYVTARYVMDRLDETVGPANWKTTAPVFGPNGQVAVGIAIRVLGEWIDKWDGAGESDIEGEKGAQSDAFKRAAVRWGLGRDLYPDAANHQGAPASAQAAGRASRPAANLPADPDSGRDYDSEPDGTPICPYHKWALRYNERYGWSCSGNKDKGGPMNAKGYCDWKPGR